MADKRKKRERYQNDSEYREHLKEYERERYRENQAVNVRDCSSALKSIQSFGEKRQVIIGGKEKTILTFSTEEIAEAIEYHPTRVRQWQGDGKFPKPTIQVKHSKLRVYNLKQAKMIVATMAKHQESNQYLRASHKDTISKLHRSMSV